MRERVAAATTRTAQIVPGGGGGVSGGRRPSNGSKGGPAPRPARLLGAVQLDERHLYSLASDVQLRPEHFYREQQAEALAEILQLHEHDRKTDHHGRRDAALARQAGPDRGRPGDDELAGWVPAAGPAREYGRIVRDNAQVRVLLRATHEIPRRQRGGTHVAPGADDRQLSADLERTREVISVLADTEQLEAEPAATRADTQAEIGQAAQHETAPRERMRADEAAEAAFRACGKAEPRVREAANGWGVRAAGGTRFGTD